MKNKERIEKLEEQVKELYYLLKKEQPIKEKDYYEQFIGRKVKGFKFFKDEYPKIGWNSGMLKNIGEIGTLSSYNEINNSFSVSLEDNWWNYPADMVIERLEPEEPTFEKGQPVWVRDNEGDDYRLKYYYGEGRHGKTTCYIFRKTPVFAEYNFVKPFVGIDPNTGKEWS